LFETQQKLGISYNHFQSSNDYFKKVIEYIFEYSEFKKIFEYVFEYSALVIVYRLYIRIFQKGIRIFPKYSNISKKVFEYFEYIRIFWKRYSNIQKAKEKWMMNENMMAIEIRDNNFFYFYFPILYTFSFYLETQCLCFLSIVLTIWFIIYYYNL
jgi:hypothetical protein